MNQRGSFAEFSGNAPPLLNDMNISSSLSDVSVRPIRTKSEWLNLIRLYRKSFPLAERKPVIILLSAWRKGKADIWYQEKSIKTKVGVRKCFLGFAVTLKGENAVLLDYLAVSDAQRGKGAGSYLLRSVIDAYPGKGFFVEIESIYEAGISNRQERLRRRRFYTKNGLSPLHVTADVFGVQMELLGKDVQMDFAAYNAFYKNNYSAFAARHVTPVKPPEHFL